MEKFCADIRGVLTNNTEIIHFRRSSGTTVRGAFIIPELSGDTKGGSKPSHAVMGNTCEAGLRPVECHCEEYRSEAMGVQK